ncbi:MAG: PqqD family protein [Acholeplasmatales bacterium]|nr:PqqD family protein [Acholeplasmatales bacterium]
MPINNNFILKEIQGDYMILPISDESVEATVIFNTNETGAYIFKKLKEGLSIDELIDEMIKEYEGLTYDVCRADVNEFIDILKKKGIYND